MKSKIKQIKNCPIIESTFEIQFETSLPKGAVFGVLFNLLKTDYPNAISLPFSQIPEDIRLTDPNLKYKPSHKVTDGNFSIFIGENVISFASPQIYPGWDKIYPKLIKFFNVLKKSSILTKVERFTLRYLNFFELDIVDKINLKIEMMGTNYKSSNILFRTEIQKEEFVQVLQISNNVTLKNNTINKKGSIIDISCVLISPENFLINYDLIEKAHKIEKDLFFGLLTESYINTLNPTYE